MSKVLRIDFISHEAARYSVARWHYSRNMPKSKLVRFGVWEGERFCGSIIYGLGANRHIARPFGLKDQEVCELVRVALAPGREHPTSKCVAISLRMLRQQSPGLKLVVSYADSGQGHIGILYQAVGFYFIGSSDQSYIRVLGKIEHPRTLWDRYGRQGQSIPWLRENVDPNAERVPMAPKLKYVFPLDRKLRRELQAIAQPYPKSVRGDTGDISGSQPEEGGSIPTRTLQSTATTV